jgi:Asp-tRNA(Asn)/Glu-tRNA(Gln) amidotransferase C subunit
MPKLHELLAVDGSLKAQADKTRTELMGTFQKKGHLFTERTQSFRPYDEKLQPVVEDQLDLQTTVIKELKWVSEFMARSLDVSYQVAEANTVARADVVMEDGTILLSQVPATSLLELEKRAKELHDFVNAIPTLDPAKGFRLDTERASEGVYKAREDRKTRTKKVSKPLVLAPGNEKHPAQVQLVTEDVPTGEITVLEWSGLITTAAKGDMLSRVEDFARAVKKARSRANEVDIPKNEIKIGPKIVNYVFGL